MNNSKYEKWIKEFMDGWKELDYNKVLNIIAKDAKYYENPIDEACSNFEDVTSLWNVIADNQKDISYTYKILCATDEICIVNWKMTRTLIASNSIQNIDGIFQISLNDEGKCTYFKQWRYSR